MFSGAPFAGHAFSDPGAPSIFFVSVTETGASVDSNTRALSAVVSASDALSGAVAQDCALAALVALVETLVADESSMLAFAAQVAVTETVSSVDSISSFVGTAIAEALNAVDHIVGNMSSGVAVSDTLTPLSVQGAGVPAGVLESEVAIDMPRATLFIPFAETMSISDTYASILVAQLRMNETGTATAAQSAGAGAGAEAHERVIGTDAAIAAYAAFTATLDAIFAHTTEQGNTGAAVGALEVVSASESQDALIQHLGEVLEVLSALDQSSLPVFFLDDRYIAYAQPRDYNAKHQEVDLIAYAQAPNYTGTL